MDNLVEIVSEENEMIIKIDIKIFEDDYFGELRPIC